jgi:hypothetical protein
MRAPRFRRIAAALIAIILAGAGAVLGLAGSASATTPSGDSYGYYVTGGTYTSSTADWTMPTLKCGTSGTSLALWTGLDGFTSDSVEQVGAEAYCAGKTAEYFGWYELYPVGSEVTFSQTLKPGDSLQASVTYSDSEFTLTLRDVTQGWTGTVSKPLAGAKRSSAETIVTAPDALSCSPRLIASFTGDTVDGSALGSLDPVKVLGGDPDITVSPVSGKTFTVTCAPTA